MRNCPDVAILSSLFGLCLSSFCLFVFLPSSLLSFCLFVFLSFCLFVFLSFCLYVFLSRHHSDEMSEGLEVSKVTICVKILKWHPVIDSLTKVRCRAARAAKNFAQRLSFGRAHPCPITRFFSLISFENHIFLDFTQFSFFGSIL